MDSRELRIGNLYDQFGHIHEVNWVVLKDLSTAPKDQLWCKPIPLTEEWLVRMGFGKDGSEWKLYPCYEVQIIVFNDGSYNGVMFYTRTIHTDYTAIYCTKHINHVHQLQNLYFALTGEELTIKLN